MIVSKIMRTDMHLLEKDYESFRGQYKRFSKSWMEASFSEMMRVNCQGHPHVFVAWMKFTMKPTNNRTQLVLLRKSRSTWLADWTNSQLEAAHRSKDVIGTQLDYIGVSF